MSEDWELPEDLLEPTRYPESNLAIKMLSCEALGHDVRALLGRFITEQSLFNVWFLKDVKGSSRGIEEVLDLTSFGEEQVRRLYEAWKEYELNLELRHLDPNAQRERVVASSASLVRALESAVTALVDVRNRGEIS